MSKTIKLFKRYMLKNRIALFLVLILALPFSCATHDQVITPPPSSQPPIKTISLPPSKTGTIAIPYEVFGEKYYPLPDAEGYVETGKASWYGEQFHGRKTSNGEIYDMYKKTAAHKTLPFNTIVKVVNLADDRFTIVRINDRGPFVRGRSIDLSYTAAHEISLIGPGVVDVKIIALGKESPGPAGPPGSIPRVEVPDFENGEFTVQIGAFKNKENADRLVERFKGLWDYVNIIEYLDQGNNTFFKVHISKSRTLSEAVEIETTLEDQGFKDAFIVRL